MLHQIRPSFSLAPYFSNSEQTFSAIDMNLKEAFYLRHDFWDMCVCNCVPRSLNHSTDLLMIPPVEAPFRKWMWDSFVLIRKNRSNVDI